MFSVAVAVVRGRKLSHELERVCASSKLGPVETVFALGAVALKVLAESDLVTVNKPKFRRALAELGYSWES
jgi:hypothetical protein